MPQLAMIASVRLRMTDDSETTGLALLSDEPTIELVISARKGDRGALEALLERCLPPLTRWAHGRLPAHARGGLDTGDLVQEAAMHVLARLDKFEPRHVGAMQAYLRMSVINRIRDEKVSATELENAKRAMIGSFALSLEQPAALLQNIVVQKLYDMPADYWDTYPQKVMAITAEDVQRIAQKYIDIGHLQIVAVGDASKTRSVLAKYGTVQEYDADGKPVEAMKN